MASKVLMVILCLSHSAFACKLKTDIVSLSGPITMMIQELELLEDKSLLAISSFHPVKSSNTAKKLMGGIFLSKKELLPFKKSIIFYDKSQDLKKSLVQADIKHLIEVDSRSKDSLQVSYETLDILEMYLKNCDEKIVQIKETLSKTKSTLRKLPKKKILFFLGPIENKLPDYIIVEDGFVISLKKYSDLITYDSNLSYVTWSRKELRKYTGFIQIGVSENKEKIEGLITQRLNDRQYNISYKGVLTPGISQVNFLKTLMRSEFLKKASL